MPFQVDFAISVRSQLDVLTAKQRATVLEAIEQQLVHEPLTETRNRKLLRPNPLAPWELRVGACRVFYEVEQHDPAILQPGQAEGVVQILALGYKRGNVLWIGGKKVEL